ncbi:UNVERIFIED_CONTAM: ABC transporter A family member 1 [Sesamum calycinum]|uniref:ABC transporter A family member 1 n=1 Tax=Sesamum calycinum TaxID=2727403 RepID=A0AAW2RTL8_9LAMI
MLVEVGKSDKSAPFDQILELLCAKGEYLAFAPDTSQTRMMINVLSVKFPLLKIAEHLMSGEEQMLAAKVYKDEEELETYMKSNLYGAYDKVKNCTNPKIKGAIVFHNQGPRLFDYSIRLNHTWAFSGFPNVKSIMDTNGPYLNDLELVGLDRRCGSELQQVMDSFIIFAAQQMTNSDTNELLSSLDSTSFHTQLKIPWTQFSPSNIRLAPFPTREYTDDEFQSIVKRVMGVLLKISPSFSLVAFSQLVAKEILLSVFSLSQFAVSSGIITLCTMGTLFKYSDKSLVFVYFFCFGLSSIMLSFLISTFFTRAKTAVAVGTLAFLAAFFPYYSVDDESVSMLFKVMASLLSPTAFALGSINFADYERAHVGLRWSNIWRDSSGVCFLFCLLMMLLDTFFILCDWSSIRKIGCMELGVLCFFKPFWRKKSSSEQFSSSSVGKLIYGDLEENTHLLERAAYKPAVEAISFEMKQQELDGRCIQIRNLHKVYTSKKARCCAVNSLQMTLYENQILALLGHNGAGKSTTMSMLVGLVRPTSGDALVFGKNILTDMLAPGTICGVERVDNWINVLQINVDVAAAQARALEKFYDTSIARETCENLSNSVLVSVQSLLGPTSLHPRHSLANLLLSAVFRGKGKPDVFISNFEYFSSPQLGAERLWMASPLPFDKQIIYPDFALVLEVKNIVLYGLLLPEGFGYFVSLLDEIRQSLGVCPQYDILFPELTVKEHLEIFANIKGVNEDCLENVATEMAEEVGLADKLNTFVRALSGGMRRKLSLGIALIGNSKVIILDEPTSGMDPYSMRLTWQLIKRIKKGRIILLTTHSMDEADALGDRIAIMANGSLKCCGSSFFLKQQYGVGYTLTLVKATPNASAAADIVYSHIPSATCVSEVGNEISFKLPIASSSSFESMFREIERCMQRSNPSLETPDCGDSTFLGIESYGISVTTLEEVFLRVAGGDFDVTDYVIEEKPLTAPNLDVNQQSQNNASERIFCSKQSVTFTTSHFNPLLTGGGGGGPIPFDLSLQIAKEVKPTEVSSFDLNSTCQAIRETFFDLPSHPRSIFSDLEVCIGGTDSTAADKAAEISLSKEIILAIGRWFGNIERVESLVSAASSSCGVFDEQLSEQLRRDGGIPLPVFSEWWLTKEKFSVIDSFIQSSFPGATYQSCDGLSIKYQLPYSEDLSLADVFGHMERNRNALGISEYSISQSTLETIFNHFATNS